MALRSDSIARFHSGDEPSDLNDVARKFMSDHEWRLATAPRPRVPVVDVNIGAADSSAPHSYEHLILSDPRLRNILQFEAGCRGFLDERFHWCSVETRERFCFARAFKLPVARRFWKG